MVQRCYLRGYCHVWWIVPLMPFTATTFLWQMASSRIASAHPRPVALVSCTSGAISHCFFAFLDTSEKSTGQLFRGMSLLNRFSPGHRPCSWGPRFTCRAARLPMQSETRLLLALTPSLPQTKLWKGWGWFPNSRLPTPIALMRHSGPALSFINWSCDWSTR